MTVVGWDSTADWDLFGPTVINTSTNTLTLGATAGEGTVEGGATGDGNDRRLYVHRAFTATDLDVRLDYRLDYGPVGGLHSAQTGIFLLRPGVRPVVFWTNIFFDANARMLLGSWEYDGTTLINTHQESFTDDILSAGVAQTFGDPARTRAMVVRQEGNRLRFKQWYTDEAEPSTWSYDDRPPAGARSGKPAHVGVLIAHTGNTRGNIYLDTLTLTSLDSVGAWGGLTSIVDENRERRAAEAAAPPESCPLCGEPLDTGPDGTLHCRHDGWTGR